MNNFHGMKWKQIKRFPWPFPKTLIGISTPWGLYTKQSWNTEHMWHEWLHVTKHWKDPLFLLKYIWYNATVGYNKNPYEIEARKFAYNKILEMYK